MPGGAPPSSSHQAGPTRPLASESVRVPSSRECPSPFESGSVRVPIQPGLRDLPSCGACCVSGACWLYDALVGLVGWACWLYDALVGWACWLYDVVRTGSGAGGVPGETGRGVPAPPGNTSRILRGYPSGGISATPGRATSAVPRATGPGYHRTIECTRQAGILGPPQQPAGYTPRAGGPSPASARPPAPPPRREHRISNLTPIAHPARRGSTGLLWRVAGGPEAGLGCGPLVGWLPGSRHRGAQAWGIRGRSALDAGVRAGRRAGRAGMGLALGKRVGSDPYYASYERSFEHLSSELHRLEVRDKPASAPGQALRALTAVCACLGTGGPEEGPAPGDREGYRQLWPGRLCAGGSVRGLGKARQQGHNLWRLARAPIACSPIWLWRRY